LIFIFSRPTPRQPPSSHFFPSCRQIHHFAIFLRCLAVSLCFVSPLTNIFAAFIFQVCFHHGCPFFFSPPDFVRFFTSPSFSMALSLRRRDSLFRLQSFLFSFAQ